MLRRFFRFAMRRGNSRVKSVRFAAPVRPVAPTIEVMHQPSYLTAAEHAAWSQARYALQQFPSENP